MGDMIVRKKIRRRREIISNPPPPWIDLPADVTANILHRLGAVEILESAQKVCATWWRVCKDPSMWRVIHMMIDPDDGLTCTETFRDRLAAMCLLAVDRSQGGLIDINIEYICTDKLMHDISVRSSRLKRLTLGSCDFLRNLKNLKTAVTKLTELEELHLFNMPWIKAGVIKAIGIRCPMLKSFTFNIERDNDPIVDNDFDYASVIAKNMPNLRQLGLYGNNLNDQGLQDILDGCPHLESLDLRRCFMVDFQGDLEKRCLERIKDLRLPFDSIDDYKWDDGIDEDDSYKDEDCRFCFGDDSDCSDCRYDDGVFIGYYSDSF